MNYGKIIKNKLKSCGREVEIIRGGETAKVWAVVESRRRKTKTLFEDNSDGAGRYYRDYYSYIGPADFDITELSGEDCFVIDSIKYELVRADRICAAGETLYFEGIIKRIWEEEDVFTQ